MKSGFSLEISVMASPRLAALPSHQIESFFSLITADCPVGFTDKILDAPAQPVIPPGIPCLLIHALLDHGPRPPVRKEKTVMIDLVSVLKSRAVHLCRHPAGIDEPGPIDRPFIANLSMISWGVFREALPFPPAM